MTSNSVAYNCTIENWILSNLDGWVVEKPTPTPEPEDDVDVEVETEISSNVEDDLTTENSNTETNTGINPFMTSTELEHKANKVITSNECQLFYEETLDMAYMHTNRLNIDDLTEIEARTFLRAVCKWTASNLWNKYNVRVNNEDLEDTYVQSYGGLLYHSAMKTLQSFIIQNITNMSSIPNTDDNDNPWIV